MSPSEPKRLKLSMVAAIWLALVVAFGAAGFDQYFKTPYLERGDIAVNALQIDNAKHFRELYGNYSRFEFNHPGPAFFYSYAVGERVLYDILRVSPTPGTAHLFAAMCLQSAFFALALGLIATHLPPRIWLPLALLTAAIYFGPLRDPYMSIWPPHVLLMPFLCFLAACCSVGTGRSDHLPYTILAGGFLFHGHVAQPLFVGSLGLLAFVLLSYQLRQARPDLSWRERLAAQRKPILASAIIAGVFLLPLLIDVILGGTRSNVATIIGRFYANTGDSKSIVQSLLYFLSFATPAQNQDEIFTVMGPQVGNFFGENKAWLVFWGSVLFATPALALVCPTRLPSSERRFLLTAHVFVFAAIAACVLWGMAQAGPMWNFNGYFYYGVYFFAFLLTLGWLDGLVRIGGSASFTSAVCAIAAVAFTWSFRLPRWSEADAGIPAKRAVELALATDTPKPKLLVFEHKDWPAVASIALDLQRKGFKFYMANWWQFMFGIQHQLTRLGATPEDEANIWWLSNPGPGGIPVSPTLSLFTSPAPINPDGDEIRFQGGDNAFRYVVSGVSAGNDKFAWAELPRTVLVFAPQPASSDVRILFDVQSAQRGPSGVKPQVALVYFNDQEVGRVTASERSILPITIPRDLWNRSPRGKLELRFPDAQINQDYKRPRFQWWTSWGMWAIGFEPVR